MIRAIQLPTLTGAGDVGAVAGTATSVFPIVGRILGVRIDYTNGSATQDVVIQTQNTSQTILTVSNNKTDGWWYTTDEAIPVVDYVQAVLSQGGSAGDTVDVTLLVDW